MAFQRKYRSEETFKKKTVLQLQISSKNADVKKGIDLHENAINSTKRINESKANFQLRVYTLDENYNPGPLRRIVNIFEYCYSLIGLKMETKSKGMHLAYFIRILKGAK